MERTDVLKEIEDVMGQGIKQHIGKLNDALNHAHGVLSKDVREYDRGLEDAWELVKKIRGFYRCRSLEDEELYIFGCHFEDVFSKYTVQEALEKVKEYEKKQEEIEVGDVVEIGN